MPDTRIPRSRPGIYRDGLRYSPPSRRSGSPGALILIVVAGIACFALGAVLMGRWVTGGSASGHGSAATPVVARGPGGSGTPSGAPGAVSADIVVNQGDTLADVADRLQATGIIQSATLFRLDVKMHGLDATIQPGTYHLTSGMTTDEIVAALHQVPTKQQATVLFKEGWRLEEDAAVLETSHVVKASEYTDAAARAGPYKPRYAFLADAPDTASLNGYLFPDTYDFVVPSPAADVIGRQLSRFDEQVTPQMRSQAQQAKRSLRDVIIIASIVEREARVADERPIIAGVYWNRLKDNEGLFADPTVQYAAGWQPAAKTWWKVLTADDLKIDSPYNTYRVKGLPPGPICNPGLASIQAALNPQGDYKYMVAKNDGSGTHAFAKTLDEHNANVKKYQP